MSPLEERVVPLEKSVEQLEAHLVIRSAYSRADVTYFTNRHHSPRPIDPEQAIRRAQRQKFLWLMQGMRVSVFTVFLCFLCWGGAVLLEYAHDYFEHQSPVVFVNPSGAHP